MTGPDFSELHDELRAIAGDVLGKASGAEIGAPLLAQAGWTGLEIAEECGGADATFRETALICEEMGRAAARSGYLGGVVLAVGLLNMLPRSPVRDQLLAEVAAGSSAVAVALSAAQRGAGPAFTLDAQRRVSGAVSFVVDGTAPWLLLPAAEPDGELVVVAVRADADGLNVVGQPVVDETRSLAAISAVDVQVDEGAVLRCSGEFAAVLDRGYLALACDSVGLAAAMLDATVAYLGVREQFGRPIGSFQAVKHACADMLVQITVARQLIDAGVAAMVADGPDAARAAAMAKAYAGEIAVQVAGKALQLHGGIGYTWEAGIHTYLKRATLNRALFGSPAEHRHWLTAQRS